MNRVASRALIVLVLVLVLLGGTVFFVVDFAMHSDDWVMKPGSPHVYQNNRVDRGVVTDANGTLLLSMINGRTYSSDASVRRGTMHWIGDRAGFVSSAILSHYAADLVGYDVVGGTYQYGEANGRMTMTLDASIQVAALQAMSNYSGTVAVMNYKTGEILCAVTTPTFDPDNAPNITEDNESEYEGVYLNRFMMSSYTPGSIFKIVTLAIALETIPNVQQQSFVCTGKVEYGVDKVTCEQAHGTQTLKEAFCNSCNCAFGQLTVQIGKEKMAEYMQRFQLVDAVSFDGIKSVKGNFDVSDAAEVQLAWSGIGQYTDLVNPCAFLRFVGAVGNGGVAVSPHVVKSVEVGKTPTYRADSGDYLRIMSENTAQIVKEYMGNNVTVKYGAENFPGLSVCAKSGTGEVGGDKRPNAMFAGFVSDTDLPLAFIAFVENGGYGARTCIPVLKPVLEACRATLN